MAYTASQPVNEVPGFARVGEAVRKGILKVTTPLFGTPENPTTFGKVMNFIDEASAYGTMAGPAAAVGRIRFAAHPVRGPRIVDARFLGSETLPLSNRLAASGMVAAPKSMFSNSPGGIAMVARDGNVILPREADVRLYRSERIRLPNGRSVPLSDIPAIASNIDASSASLAQKQAAVAKLNEAATPYWMYWMYEKDIADANATLARFRSGGRWYDNANVRNYDVLARGDAATVVGNPIGTRYQVGQTVFSPNHVSAMSRDRFIKDPRLFDVYNDGYLPYQSMTFTAAPKLVKGKSVTPVMRVTDHHETVRGPTGSLVYGGSDLKLPHTEYRTYDRTYHVGRDIPYFNFKANEPGGVDLMYMLDNGTPVVRNQGSYSASVAVQQASKGGDSPHRNFRNFLATDKVPDSIFGYPVVQREEDYTPEDLEFFRKNPKAAGFYDLGDDEIEEDVPQQAAKAGGTKKVSYDDLRRLADTKYAKDADPIKAAVYSLPPEVVSATVDSFGGNIDRAARPVYLHKDAEGWVTGYSTTNSGDALDPGTDVSSGKFKAVLVPFVRFGKGGKPEYTEDRAMAQKWYDESGQHYGKFDMDFTSEAAKKRSVDRFNAASWLVHREQQLRYQPVFDKMKAEANAARLGKLWANAVKATGGNTNGMAKVFYAMTGESAPNQRGASDTEISNGYRVRLAVHGNETRRKKENPHNKGLADTYTNLGTLEKDSDVIQNYKWGTGPGTNWFDVATMQPRYEAIVRDPTALATTRSLIVDAARFLNGELSVPGLPNDAYHYGDGRKGLVSDAKGLSTAEMKAIGPLPKNFRVGRKKGR